MTLEGLNDNFRDVVVQFVDAGAEFVIVGALAFHGAPRASGDIDIFVRPSSGMSRDGRFTSSGATPCSRTRRPRGVPRTSPMSRA
jgi:hypothetical protein